MHSNQMLLDVLSNNLANLNTVGYKRDGVAFAETFEREMYVPGARFSRHVGSLGGGATVAAEFTYSDTGPAISTGNPLDLMLEKPNQFLSVQTPQGIRYTRDGALRINSDGNLATRDGYAVLDINLREIRVGGPGENQTVEITRSGVVLTGGTETAVLDVQEGSFRKVGRNLWSGNGMSVADPALLPATLEGSNVNAIHTMIQMIALMRNFDSAQRAIRTQDEMTERLLQSLASR